ncbi:MAG TPA: NAD-dependent epimerase/dehydratase family protein [Nevskiaceae bacterium]|nr:NAD-dependent epimerase/dehydratase family protein [Nevskiaceae bacterium]
MASQNEKGAARKTVLVTGAAGSLAQRVIARLHPRYQVVAVDFRRKVETDAGIPSYLVQLYKRTFEDIFAAHAIDAVIHIGRMYPHEHSRAQRYNANVMGTRRMFELCAKYHVGQVLVHSTYFVYGASAYNPALIPEDAPLKASELTQDLVDSVELESLASVQMWKHPELHVTVLRPCNVLGPGVHNSMSILLSHRVAPILMGFAPLMQFVHVDDMADAVALAFEQNKPGIYNVAPDDYAPYPDAVRQCGCHRLPVLSVPPLLPRAVSRLMSPGFFFPPYLINYFKYPVIIDGRLFRDTFGWRPRRSLNDIFSWYRQQKHAVA